MKQRFLEILKEAYPQGFSPINTSGQSLQLWREEIAFALEAAAQRDTQPSNDSCALCGRTHHDHVIINLGHYFVIPPEVS